MSSPLLRKPVKSYIRSEECADCRRVPSQHPEDISKNGATSSRVRCPSLAGHSRLPSGLAKSPTKCCKAHFIISI